jgi:hypothetical protein
MPTLAHQGVQFAYCCCIALQKVRIIKFKTFFPFTTILIAGINLVGLNGGNGVCICVGGFYNQ